jgi:hypothetical protein
MQTALTEFYQGVIDAFSYHPPARIDTGWMPVLFNLNLYPGRSDFPNIPAQVSCYVRNPTDHFRMALEEEIRQTLLRDRYFFGFGSHSTDRDGRVTPGPLLLFRATDDRAIRSHPRELAEAILHRVARWDFVPGIHRLSISWLSHLSCQDQLRFYQHAQMLLNSPNP